MKDGHLNLTEASGKNKKILWKHKVPVNHAPPHT